jgi:dTDP-4-amino-4,6-dideoxygalactose transaminase
MKKRIWLSSPNMGGGEIKYVNEAFESNWIAPLGPNVDGFEQDLQSYLDIRSAVALCSGTAAIHLALILLGIKQNDEVLVSSFTFSATVNPVIYQKAIPIFIDCEKDTWNMDPELLEEAIKDRMRKGKRLKAILLVHLYGMPAKMDEIMRIANKYEIPVIEDAAEALGSSYKDQKLGTFGKFGILSFNGNKIITTSGGGALISNDKNAVKKARFLATQSRDDAPHYQHSEIGYNYRMSNVLAGIGRGQMEILEERIEQKRNINKWYKSILDGVDGISLLKEADNNNYSNFWLTTVLIDERRTGFDREKLRLAFENENIEARPLWKPMHLQPVFKKYSGFINETSENLFNTGLCLPSDSNIDDDDKNRIERILLQM